MCYKNHHTLIYCNYESNRQFQMSAIAWHQLMFLMYFWYSIFILKKSSSQSLQPKDTEKITSSLAHTQIYYSFSVSVESADLLL